MKNREKENNRINLGIVERHEKQGQEMDRQFLSDIQNLHTNCQTVIV